MSRREKLFKPLCLPIHAVFVLNKRWNAHKFNEFQNSGKTNTDFNPDQYDTTGDLVVISKLPTAKHGHINKQTINQHVKWMMAKINTTHLHPNYRMDLMNYTKSITYLYNPLKNLLSMPTQFFTTVFFPIVHVHIHSYGET